MKSFRTFIESYVIMHKDFSSAVQHAKAQAEKSGYKIDDNEWFRKVSSGPRKPTDGNTNSYSIELIERTGRVSKKMLHMQIYNTGNKFELNMYIQ